MPSVSPKQARLMRAVAHGWRPDKFKGPSVAVAKEFVAADEKRPNMMKRMRARRKARHGS